MMLGSQKREELARVLDLLPAEFRPEDYAAVMRASLSTGYRFGHLCEERGLVERRAGPRYHTAPGRRPTVFVRCDG